MAIGHLLEKVNIQEDKVTDLELEAVAVSTEVEMRRRAPSKIRMAEETRVDLVAAPAIWLEPSMRPVEDLVLAPASRQGMVVAVAAVAVASKVAEVVEVATVE